MMQKLFGVYLPIAIFVLTLVALFANTNLITMLTESMSGLNAYSYVTYVAILVIAVVAMPITVMPLIPVASALFGPLITSVLSVVGWTVGGAIAFLVARHIGRPVIERFVCLKKIDDFTDKIPTETRFLSIVLLRLTLPVDIVSYALGLSTKIGFFEYVAATLVGVIWFSFAFAYMGDALLNRDVLLLIEIGAASVLVFTVCWLVLRRKQK